MILCLGGYVLDPRLTDSYLAYRLTLHPLFSLSSVACFWIFQSWLSLTLKIGSVSLSHSVRASDVLRRTFPLFHAGCENSPQPFHGTQATPVMPSTKSRPWDWHRPAPSSCFVTRLTALQPVGIWGLLGLDWLWGHCQPPCRFPDSSRIRFVVGVRSFCSDMSQQFSRTQCGHTYFREICPRAPKLAAVVGEVQELSTVWYVVLLHVLTLLCVVVANICVVVCNCVIAVVLYPRCH
jgi:hypothetical protein